MSNDETTTSAWNLTDLLSPAVCAVAAFALAAASLLGQNAITIGIGALLDSVWSEQGPTGYYAYAGVATLAQLGGVLLLARRAFDAPDPWQRLLGRAAVLVAGIAATGGLLAIVGAIVA